MDNITKCVNKKRKLSWKNDNLLENKLIKSLEKKLKINKKISKYVQKSFVSDGLDYLLNICDEEKRKIIADSEKRLLLQLNESENSDNDNNAETELKSVFNQKNNIDNSKIKTCGKSIKSFLELDTDKDIKNNIKNCSRHKSDICKNYQLNSKVKSTEISSIEHVNKNIIIKEKKINCKKDSISSKNTSIKNEETSVNKLFKNKINNNYITDKLNFNSSNQESDFQNKEGSWEDIYGRKRDKDGIIISRNERKHITPSLRLNNFKNNVEKNGKLLFLKRQIKGLLNRLAQSNMHVIISQLDELYMSNSRNNMNEILSNVMIESIISPVLTAEQLVIEHMMCIVILHANIGIEVGAYFIMIFIKKFHEMIQKPQYVLNKEIDNLCLMISHLYNFKVFGSQLMYQILEKLICKFAKKEIELILLILKTTGFKLRKDNPVALKELILNVQQKAAAVKLSNTKIQFMLEILLAIKNNNMNKILQHDQIHIEHLNKILKSLIRKGNVISQLNLSFEDLLNVDKKGKWWIVGSVWTDKSMLNNKLTKSLVDKPVYSQKILKLAETQRMNTDIRKNIFCILMTAEDYLDAFEKLHHLGLKDRQEREIIYVILNCLLQEQPFNPYYSVLIQKFCEYDRKYQIIMQYTLWDKMKMLNSYNNKQVITIAKLMSYLFIQKALPLSILKVIQFGELDTTTTKLFKKIMLDILLYENTEACLHVFERIALSMKLHQFREALKLFINYFFLKNIKKETISEKQFHLLEERIKLVDKILTTSDSKITL